MKEASAECTHESVPSPPFDEERAKAMTSTEVRREFPRFTGKCPDCGCDLIKYASFMHYMAGDY